ncbi:MAG: TadE/TadG family type IV pilus assembly protein [Stellaceae bacterium]|jgi:Flp pilus assembly protein TadG
MLRRLHNLIRNQYGTVLVEFAFVAPIMITLFMGVFEVTRVVAADMRLANAATIMAEMVAQQTTVSHATSSSIPDFCNGGKLAMTPLASSAFQANIVSVTNYSSGRAVDWNDTTCGGPTAMSSTTAKSLATTVTPNTNDSVIIVQVTYAYTSPISYILKSSYTLTQTSYARPRAVSTPPIPYS